MKKVSKDEKFGCEPLLYGQPEGRGIDKETASSVRALNLWNGMLVPVRESGLSSQGDELLCWYNVMKMVCRYGGEVLLGYQPCKTPNKAYLMRHAVWLTPEGRPVCITKSNLDHDSMIVLQNSKGKNCIPFYVTHRVSQQDVFEILEGEEKLPNAVSAIMIDSNNYEVVMTNYGIAKGFQEKTFVDRQILNQIMNEMCGLPTEYFKKAFRKGNFLSIVSHKVFGLVA